MRNRRGETEEMRRMRGLIERRSEFVPRSTILPPAPEPTTLEGQTQHRIGALRMIRYEDGIDHRGAYRRNRMTSGRPLELRLIPARLYEPRLLDGDDD
jgi:hypothetical protein